MISIVHWISASRRLTEIEKTIIMLGGKQNPRDVPNMVLAQRDMIKLERDYYRDKAIDFMFICAFIGIAVASFFAVKFVLLKG